MKNKPLCIIAITENIQSPALITPWSFIHFMYGVVFLLLAKRFTKWSLPVIGLTCLVIGMIYEIKDIYHSYVIKEDNYFNSFENSLADIVVNTLGFLFAVYAYNHVDTIKLEICVSLVFVSCLFFVRTHQKVG